MRTHSRFMIVVLALALAIACLPSPVHAAPQVTGSFAIGSVATDIIHLGGAPQRPDAAVAEVTLNVKNLLGPVNLAASYRQPFHDGGFWNRHIAKGTVTVSFAAGPGECFGTWERSPYHDGFEYAWIGYRVPFKL